MTAPPPASLTRESKISIGLTATLVVGLLSGLVMFFEANAGVEKQLTQGQARLEALAERVGELSAAVIRMEAKIDGKHDSVLIRLGKLEAEIAALKAAQNR